VKSKVDWSKIKVAYQSGQGSCQQLADRFKVSVSTLEKRCHREKWLIERQRIGNVAEKRIGQALEETIIDEATAWVRRIKASCERDLERIEETYEQLHPAADPVAVRCLTQAKKSVDDMMRRALCLPDSPQKVEHSGGIDQQTIIRVIDPYALPPGERPVRPSLLSLPGDEKKEETHG
jgi:hypothetical protein